MQNLYCTICNKYYHTSKALWNHNKKYHDIIETSVKVRTKSNVVKCNYCETKFAHPSSKYKHQKNCKENPINEKTDIVTDDGCNNNITKYVVDLASKIVDNPTNGHNIDSNNKNNKNNNNNNNNNSLNSNSYNKNNCDNVNITIISLGQENITNVLTAQQQQNIMKQENYSLEELVKIVHFNKKHPQFHNIAINDDKAYTFNQSESKFIEQSKEDLIYDVIKHRVHDLREINNENKLYLPKKIYKFMNMYIKTFNTLEHYERHAKKIEKLITKGTDDLLNTKKINL